eukprot:5434117-Amphidinium_carterae.1
MSPLRLQLSIWPRFWRVFSSYSLVAPEQSGPMQHVANWGCLCTSPCSSAKRRDASRRSPRSPPFTDGNPCRIEKSSNRTIAAVVDLCRTLVDLVLDHGDLKLANACVCVCPDEGNKEFILASHQLLTTAHSRQHVRTACCTYAQASFS